MVASLQHVSMWTSHGWQYITVEEADQLHPGGTVSASSGLFICELCGQYVTFTKGNKNKRYFKHSRGDKEKDCPERKYAQGQYRTFSEKSHKLPIRIKIENNKLTGFEMGFIRLPHGSLTHDFKILITSDDGDMSYEYNSERLSENGITYLSLGDSIHKKYKVSIKGGLSKIKDIIPSEVNGISGEGTLFDKDFGHMLPYDADVVIGKEYYLLLPGILSGAVEGVKIKLLSKHKNNDEKWRLYLVSATQMGRIAANFFYRYHGRLTDRPIEMQPVWPLYTEDNYVIRHNCNETMMYVRGNVFALKLFPPVMGIQNPIEEHPICKYKTNEKKEQPDRLYRIKCKEKQQVISIGRAELLKSLYFWKEAAEQRRDNIYYEVTDIENNIIAIGEYDKLPSKRILLFFSRYDAEIVIKKNGSIIDRRNVAAKIIYELDNIYFDLTLEFWIGLDCLWTASFKSTSIEKEFDDDAILHYINGAKGELIDIPHSLRNISLYFVKYPKLSLWIKNCIKAGSINKNAFRKLQRIYCEQMKRIEKEGRHE